METKPLVTVITPTYNCGKFIAETMESVLCQEYQNIQYIVLDDGSTDNTLNEIANFDYGEDRLEVSRHINMGEQKTVNKGLESIRGKYFMIVNADDPLLAGAIRNLVDYMEGNPQVLCAYPDWLSINEDGSIRTFITSLDYVFNYMVRHHTCLPSVGSIFRTEPLKEIRRDTSYHWLGDFKFWFQVGLLGDMARVPLTLASWRHRTGQLSKDKSDARGEEHIRLMKEFYAFPIALPPNLLKVKGEAVCWSYLVAASVSKSKLKILYYILEALKNFPQLLFQLEFYETLVRRAFYILRR